MRSTSKALLTEFNVGGLLTLISASTSILCETHWLHDELVSHNLVGQLKELLKVSRSAMQFANARNRIVASCSQNGITKT